MKQIRPVNISEYEQHAQALLEPAIWDYFAGGSADEMTLRENQAAFQRIQIRPRMLTGVSTGNLSMQMLDIPCCMPVGIAPLGAQKLLHPEGELAMARAAGKAGMIMIASCMSNTSLEEIAAVATGPLWFQLYNFRDQALTYRLIQRAEQAGYQALVLTIDTPRMGKRERDMRNGFGLPPSLKMENFQQLTAAIVEAAPEGTSGFATHTQTYFDPAVTWDVIGQLRAHTTLPLLLKGVLTHEDALLAITHGIEGIIVSNHGGRQLDTVSSTIEILPEIIATVKGRCEVYLDGGIRRGTDIFKALALGARGVFLGRPLLWGLAVNGEQGVTHTLEILRAELELTMVLAGRATIQDIDSSAVRLFTAHAQYDAPAAST